MKPFHLKDTRIFVPPYMKDLQEMINTTKERSVDISNGLNGIILGNKVLTPYQFKESFIAKKDDKNLVLTYEKTDKWGISYFLLPNPIPCEPLRFRHKPIHQDTYLFRVWKQVHMCIPFAVSNGKGMYGLDSPDQFTPVFDRHGHLIGINSGVFCDKLLCIPIQELV